LAGDIHFGKGIKARIIISGIEKISNRIINEVKGVNRVVYDITQKPPGTIEYE